MDTKNKDKNRYARCFATEKIEDQKALKKIILNTKEDWFVRCAAIRVYRGNKSILEQIALSDKSQNVRRAATERLENQAVLEQLAVDDKYWGVRYYATKKLQDQMILEWIAIYDADHNVRSAAVERMKNQVALEQIALNDAHWLVRFVATKQLKNQAILEQIAEDDPEHDVRCAAVLELDKQGAFKHVSISDDGWCIYHLALPEATDKQRTITIKIKAFEKDRYERKIRSFATPRQKTQT